MKRGFLITGQQIAFGFARLRMWMERKVVILYGSSAEFLWVPTVDGARGTL